MKMSLELVLQHSEAAKNITEESITRSVHMLTGNVDE